MKNPDDLEISLLGFLVEKPMHGYDLHRHVTDLKGFGIVWRLKIGKLYNMLGRLHAANLVDVENYQDGKRPVRNEYRITADGLTVLEGWLRRPVRHGRDFRSYFMLKLLFSLKKSKSAALQLIEIQKRECQAWHDHFAGKMPANSHSEGGGEADAFSGLVRQYRRMQIDADLEWLAWSAQQIGEEK